MPNPPSEPSLCNADLAELREKLGCSLLELTYVLGRTTVSFPIRNADKARTPIKSLPLSYMVRLLGEEPDLAASLFPKWPTYEEVYKTVAGVWDQKTYGRLSGRKFAILCGVTPWTYAKWVSGENQPTASTLRLFAFLRDIIRRKGQEGLRIYLDCLERDARSRGKKGLRDLFRSPPKKKKSKVNFPEKT